MRNTSEVTSVIEDIMLLDDSDFEAFIHTLKQECMKSMGEKKAKAIQLKIVELKKRG